MDKKEILSKFSTDPDRYYKVKLFDTTFMNTSTNEDQKQREESGQVKPVTVDNFFTKISTKEKLKDAINIKIVPNSKGIYPGLIIIKIPIKPSKRAAVR